MINKFRVNKQFSTFDPRNIVAQQPVTNIPQHYPENLYNGSPIAKRGVIPRNGQVQVIQSKYLLPKNNQKTYKPTW